MKKLLAALAIFFAAATAADAQTCPAFRQGLVLTPAQWQACFDAKQNALGYTALNRAGDTMLGRLVISAPTGNVGFFNLTPGTAPPSPINGDMWATTSGVFARVNGVTIGPFSGATSSSFAATAPLAVTFPAGVTTYALNYDASLTNNAGSLGIDLAHSNVFSVLQTISLNAGTLPTAVTGTTFRTANTDGTVNRITSEGYANFGTFTTARADGTAASPTQVLSGEQIGAFNAFAWGSNAAWNGTIASMRIYAAENISGTTWGSKICWATTPSTTVTIADSLCQQNSGGITVGAPSGGDKGSGTINATAIYVAGTALSASAITALTTDVTATGPGSVAATIAANAVTNAKAAQMAAYTFKGNATGSLANAQDFTIDGLTAKATPVGADELILADSAASFATKKCSITNCIAAVTSGVASLVGLTGILTIANGGGVSANGSGTVLTLATFKEPAGRLTVTSNTPVLTADATAQATLYYDCYRGGNRVPYFDGTNDQVDLIAACEVSTAMVSAASAGQVVSGNLYDVWWVHGGANRICLAMSASSGGGGGWSADTAGSNTARGTGYSQIDRTTRPYVTNANSITNCFNAATNYGPVSANQGTYLGTIYATANGQTGMSFRPNAANGGNNNILGVYNAYNRVRIAARSQDNTASWTNASSTVVPANVGGTGSGLNNRISWVDGLQQSAVKSSYQVYSGRAQSGADAVAFGVCLDATNAYYDAVAENNAAIGNNFTSSTHVNVMPKIGFHFSQACENNPGNAAGATFYGLGDGGLAQPTMQLNLELEM